MEKNRGPSSTEIAVLFTDVVNSTEYFKKYGDDKGRNMLKLHQDLVSPYILAFDGLVLKTVGDSIMAYFKDPDDALKAAICIQQKLKRFRTGRGDEDKIQIRIGIDYGKTLFEEGDIFGDVVNVASRLTDLSDVNGILISDNVFSRVNDLPGVSFSEFPESRNIDILKDIPVYRVIWEEKTNFEPKKRIGIFVNFLPPLSGEKGREIITDNWEEDFFPFDAVYPLREDSVLVIPKKDAPIVYCMERIRSSFTSYCARTNIRGFMPLRIVIHMFSPLNCPGQEEESEIPWQTIGPGEAFISSEARVFVTDPIPLDESLGLKGEKHRTYLKLRWLSGEETAFSEEDFRSIFLSGEHMPCFYCGDRRHRASRCPSKRILDISPRIEEVGYITEEELNRAFFSYLTCGTKVLEEIEKKTTSYDILTKIHLAFFEVKKIFQLRFLKFFLSHEASEWEELKKSKEVDKKGGLLWIAIDSLRVSDYERTLELIKKAEDEIKDEFGTFCVKGFYYMERGEEESAKSSFHAALKHARTKAEKTYSLFLLARLSFVYGDMKKTGELLREISNLAYDSVEARYFDLIFKLYSSRFFEKEKEANVKKLVKLVEAHREYFVYVFLDPELAPFFSNIKKELDRIAASARKDAEELLLKAKEFFNSTRPLLLDDEIKEIETNLERARRLKEMGGYFAFLELKEVCRRTVEKLSQIRGRRGEEIESTRLALRAKIRSIKAFVDSYPYGFFIRKAKEELKDILARFHALENEISFSKWKKESDLIEDKIISLEKRIKTADEILYGMKLVGRFLKVSAFLILVISFLDFLVFPFFSSRFQDVIPYDFPSFQKIFFVGGILISLMISFYSAIRRVNR